MVAAAAIGAGVAGVAGSAISGSAASSAAGQQSAAAQQAANDQLAEFQQTQSNLAPYQGAGQAGLNQLTNNLGAYGATSSPYFDQMASSVPQKQGDVPGLSGIAGSIPTNNLAGAVPGNPLTGQIPTVPGQMTEAQLEQMPGYQFTKNQGLQSVQNSAAARGLGVSGAALKGAANYATGLADQNQQQFFNQQQSLFNNAQQNYQDLYTGNLVNQQNFQDQNAVFNANQGINADQVNAFNAALGKFNAQNQLFNQGQTQFGDYGTLLGQQQGMLTNSYNRLSGLGSLGENAAATVGNQGIQAQNNVGNYLTGAANAGAAGTIGAANALTGGLNTAAGAGMNYAMLNQLMGGSSLNPFSTAAADPFATGTYTAGGSAF